jgi:hypothetical protein
VHDSFRAIMSLKYWSYMMHEMKFHFINEKKDRFCKTCVLSCRPALHMHTNYEE